jgi:putative flippase GtrA
MAITITKQDVTQGLKFTVFSLGAGAIEFSTATLLDLVFHVDSHIAYLIGLILSVLFNFTFNRRYTFKSAANVPVAMIKVACFYAVFTPSTTLLDHYLTQTLGLNSTLVLIGIMLLNFILEFLYCRFYVYRGTINTNHLAQKTEQH